VETVVLLSQVPLEQIQSVRLDSHSRTSNKLIRILADRLWKTDWDFYFEENHQLSPSCLMIGDKVFKHRANYAYHYDLASAWKTLTGLPMVFAVWIARPGVPDHVIEALDHACAAGLDVLQKGESGLSQWQNRYLLDKISYPLDANKIKAMELYLEMAQSLENVEIYK
jgi:chorismate dehydratase